MHSVLSRCSLILPLVCALMVASQTNRTVRSYKNNLYISTFGAAENSSVAVVSDSGSADVLKINPRPNPNQVVYSSFYSTGAGFYVGVNQLEANSTLTWVDRAYTWRVAPFGDFYKISDSDLDFLWYDGNNAGSDLGTITLKKYDDDSDANESYWLFGVPP